MIEVCCCCSKVNVDVLKTMVPEDQLKVGCIEQCESHPGKSYGVINGEMVVVDNEQEFFDAVRSVL